LENKLITVLDWVRFACSQFTHAQREKRIGFGHGTSRPLDEAVWLVTAALSLDPEHFDLFAQATVTTSETAKIEALIHSRLTTGQPLAYLLGEAWLMGQRFVSDARALVPRSLIAELLEQSLEPFLAAPPKRVLDMCTGGGSLAMLAALNFPDSRVTGVDISAQALALAKENRALFELEKRVQFLQSDLFDKVKGKFDLIVCNPPYVNANSMKRLPKEFLSEPQLALHGGEFGMDLITRIMREVPDYLTKSGVLVLELGHEAGNFERHLGHIPVTWLPTSGGDQAVFVITRSELIAA
jgi:ribosomal protein L3 glutamine methyltransferase